jgi:MFS transporter, FHS family, glucose/mannose:H+ symporter
MTTPSSSLVQSRARTEWLLLHVSFVLIGVITTLLGPILPFFIRHWSLTDAQAGSFFTTQYFGSFIGVALISVALSRYGFSKVTAAGFVAFVLGFLLLGIGPWALAAFIVGVIGFGYGLTNPAINLRGTQLPSKNTAAAVTLLNFSWTVGAVFCPFLVGPLIPLLGLRGFCLALAVASVIFMVLHISLRAPAPNRAARVTHSLGEWLAHLRSPQAIPLLLLFFLYVGVEVALGGWVASFEKRMPGMGAVTLVVAPSVFYGFLLLGRGIAPLVLRRVKQVRICVGGLVLATLGAAIITLSNAPHTLYLGAAIAGFGLAPQYPIFVTWLAAIFREDSNWIGALFFGAAGLGGGTIPGLVGIVSANTHSLRVGLCIPLAIDVMMVFLAFRARPSSLQF